MLTPVSLLQADLELAATAIARGLPVKAVRHLKAALKRAHALRLMSTAAYIVHAIRHTKRIES